MRISLVSALLLAACVKDRADWGEGESEGERSCGGRIHQCGEDGVFQRCVDGSFVDAGRCDAACREDRCEKNQCADRAVIRCDASGHVSSCDPEVGGFLDPAPCPKPGESCFDDGMGEDCNPRVCVPSLVRCRDDSTVVGCNATGSAEEVVASCTPAQECSQGACLSRCDAAELERRSIGCLYYAIDNDTLDSPDDTYQYTIIVANPGDPATGAVADVLLEKKNGADYASYAAATVLAGQSHTFNVTCSAGEWSCRPDNIGADLHPEGTGMFPGYGFRLSSSVPVAAYQLNSDDVNGAASSTGTTILLPKGAIDRVYYAMSWPHTATRSFGTPSGASFVAIVSTADGTLVTVRFAANVVAGGSIPAYQAGESGVFSLDEGDVVQFSTGIEGEDLTGTYIEANQDVVVFAGNEDADMGGVGSGRNDAMVEVMMPVTAWGMEYVAARTPIYASMCDGAFPPVSGETSFVWRVLAAENQTSVTMTGDSTLAGLPATPVMVDAGQFTEFSVTGSSSNPGNFGVAADQPIMVAQYVNSGPTAMVLMPPVEQYLPEFAFATTDGFRDVLTVVRPIGATVLVDGLPPSGTWITASEDFEVLSMDVCTDGVVHTVKGGGSIEEEVHFAAFISGNGGVCSYSFQAGFNQQRINIID